MDKFSDFFKDLKERISSPLISSFIFSWLVFNWQIVIALFKYEVKSLSLKDYQAYVDYICSLINKYDCFWHPLAVAFGYALLYPFLRNGIQIADAWFKAWGNHYKLMASKTNKVSIEKYIQLRETYKQRSDLLQEVLDKESITIQKNETLVNQNSELKSKTNGLESDIVAKNEKISELENRIFILVQKIESDTIRLSKYSEKDEAEKNRNLVESLNGKWTKKEYIKGKEDSLEVDEKMRFEDGKVFYIDKDGIETPAFQIVSYEYNNISRNINILTNTIVSNIKLSFTLVPNDDFTLLKGISSISRRGVTFEKQTS